MFYHWLNQQETRKINAFGVFGGPSTNLNINYVKNGRKPWHALAQDSKTRKGTNRVR